MSVIFVPNSVRDIHYQIDKAHIKESLPSPQQENVTTVVIITYHAIPKVEVAGVHSNVTSVRSLSDLRDQLLVMRDLVQTRSGSVTHRHGGGCHTAESRH